MCDVKILSSWSAHRETSWALLWRTSTRSEGSPIRNNFDTNEPDILIISRMLVSLLLFALLWNVLFGYNMGTPCCVETLRCIWSPVFWFFARLLYFSDFKINSCKALYLLMAGSRSVLIKPDTTEMCLAPLLPENPLLAFHLIHIYFILQVYRQ